MWNPKSQNLYGYVQNNPLIFTDPSGHATSKEYKLNYSDLRELGKNPIKANFIIGAEAVIGYTWTQNASNYAENHNPQYYHGTLLTWDNEADAYRHFSWNYSMAQDWGKDVGEIFGNNHEVGSDNYTVLSNENGKVRIAIQLASLMDLNNNKVGREMTDVYGYDDSDQAFKDALAQGTVITSLDQVSQFLHFDSSLVYKINDKDYVNAEFYLKDKNKGIRSADFHYFSNWSFVSNN